MGTTSGSSGDGEAWEQRSDDEGWGEGGMQDVNSDSGEAQGGGEEFYGLVERQILFKLIAAHALVDAEFYKLLRTDPAAAIAEMHIALPDDDMEYLKGVVDWPVLDEHAEAVREALHTDAVVRSLW
jgi:hypothetical protein